MFLSDDVNTQKLDSVSKGRKEMICLMSTHYDEKVDLFSNDFLNIFLGVLKIWRLLFFDSIYLKLHVFTQNSKLLSILL